MCGLQREERVIITGRPPRGGRTNFCPDAVNINTSALFIMSVLRNRAGGICVETTKSENNGG